MASLRERILLEVFYENNIDGWFLDFTLTASLGMDLLIHEQIHSWQSLGLFCRVLPLNGKPILGVFYLDGKPNGQDQNSSTPFFYIDKWDTWD